MLHDLLPLKMQEDKYSIHPGRLTWNLQITHLERKMIFQTSMIMFHVNLQGCIGAETCVTYTNHRGDDKIGCFFLLLVVGFLRVPGCPRGGGNWGTLRIP